MRIRYGYDFTISCQQPTHLVMLVSARPEHDAVQQGTEWHASDPAVPVTLLTDQHGNRARRLTVPAGNTRLTGGGTVWDDGQPDPVYFGAGSAKVEYLPDAVLPYLRPSRYCETDVLSQFAWDMFGQTQPGWTRVQAVMDWVHNHIRFDYMQARATRTANDVLREGVGVCRDFAHLGVALCRCLNIPTRYVNGHLGDIGVPVSADPMDYAAWVEVFLDGAWHTFDPRNNARRIGRIVVARGLDAADVPMIQSFGPHLLTAFRVIAEEEPEMA